MKVFAGRALAVVSALMLVGIGCTDDPAGTRDPNNSDNNRQSANNINPDPPANSELRHVDPCSPASPICSDSLTFSSGRLLQVQLLDGEGQPVDNTNVKFTIESSDAEGSRLSAANAGTNSQGLASTELTVGSDAGSVEIAVSTTDTNVEPIRFVIAVSPKGQSSYNVRFEKIGQSDPEKIKVYFYEDSVTCADFMRDVEAQRDDDPTTNPALTAEFSKDGIALGDGTLPIVQLDSVPNGTAYTVGAQAYSRTNDSVEVAVGCKDSNPAVENGTPVEVVVPLIKNLPYIKGNYNAVHEFDLISGLPENIQNIVNLLGYAISSPGTFIVGCESMGPNDDECPVTTGGLSDVLINVLPDDGLLGDLKDALDSFLNSGFAKDAVRDTINDAVDDFLNNNPNVPSWLKDSRTITADILDTLRKFEVVGVIKIKEQPVWATDANGVPSVNADGTLTALWDFDPANVEGEYNEQRWDNISFYWSRGCDANSPPECGKRTVGATTLGTTGELVRGYFDGFLIDGNVMHVNQHTLTLNYGLLLLTVVEKVVLPEIFGPGVDSIEAMLTTLINCEAVANSVDSGQGTFYNLTKSACELGIAEGTEALRNYVTEELTAQGDDNFLIATPEGEGCQLYPAEDYVGEWPGKPLPYIDSMGKDDPDTLRCKWAVEVKFSSNTQTQINGEFNAVRD